MEDIGSSPLERKLSVILIEYNDPANNSSCTIFVFKTFKNVPMLIVDTEDEANVSPTTIADFIAAQVAEEFVTPPRVNWVRLKLE